MTRCVGVCVCVCVRACVCVCVHVLRCAAEGEGLKQTRLSTAEIAELDPSVAIDEEGFGFEVTVQDIVRV